MQYAYAEMAGGANNSRLTSMTYPNGRVLNYNYNAGLDSSISRLSSLSDTSATLEAYSYLGLDTVVQRAHPQTGVNLTYLQQPGDGQANTDGGDQYTGLDRFGRVIDQNWLNPATHTAADRFQYGYDRDSNPLYRNNLVNPAFGELYHASGAGQGYDQLNQLTAFARGTLSASQQGGPLDTVAAPSHSQSWALDALGNTTTLTTDGVPQARTANGKGDTVIFPCKVLYIFFSPGGLHWDTFDQFDGTGRLILEAAPSAVTGYSDAHADLLNGQGGNYQYLSDTTGLVATSDFATATTAGETTAGQMAGYIADDKVQRGELGTAIDLDSQQYFAHTVGGITVPARGRPEVAGMGRRAAARSLAPAVLALPPLRWPPLNGLRLSGRWRRLGSALRPALLPRPPPRAGRPVLRQR